MSEKRSNTRVLSVSTWFASVSVIQQRLSPLVESLMCTARRAFLIRTFPLTSLFTPKKVYDVMDPIYCVKNATINDKVGSHCWVDGGTTIDDDTRYGGYFFPIIQHRNPSCSWCKKGAYSSKRCNIYDMEFLLLFHSADPSKPYYAKFNNSNHYHYDFGSVSADTHPTLSYSCEVVPQPCITI